MADWFASPNGTGSGDDPADPSNLSTAVEAAAAGDTIFILLPNVGGTPIFQEDLVGNSEINDDITFDTYTRVNNIGGIEGIVAIDGDVTIEANTTLTLADNLELRLVGQPGTLELRDGAEINGDGVLACTATGGDHIIRLGSPNASPPFTTTGSIRNLRIDKPNGDVNVIDPNPSNGGSNLHITNRLQVDGGELRMNNNNLHITARPQVAPAAGEDPEVEIAAGASISGSGTFFIAVEAADQGGFPNTLNEGFRITGDGNLNMNFEKTTNAGVVIELIEIGAGGQSLNRAGALYVTEAVQFNGTFRNAFAARTEFWVLQTITDDLEVEGPGGEVFGGDGQCGTGQENGIYVNPAVNIEGRVILVNTDDPNLPCGIQGLSCFEPESDA